MKNAERNTTAAVPVRKSLGKQIRRHWEFYLLLLPGIILTIIFKYIPISGITMQWTDF